MSVPVLIVVCVVGWLLLVGWMIAICMSGRSEDEMVDELARRRWR